MSHASVEAAVNSYKLISNLEIWYNLLGAMTHIHAFQKCSFWPITANVHLVQLGLWKAGDTIQAGSNSSTELNTRFSWYLWAGWTGVCWSWSWISLSYCHFQGVSLADVKNRGVLLHTLWGQWAVLWFTATTSELVGFSVTMVKLLKQERLRFPRMRLLVHIKGWLWFIKGF